MTGAGGASNVIAGALTSIGADGCIGGAGVQLGSSGDGSLGLATGGTEPK
ncbi:MAG: hypothetical protein WD794_06075 [Mycobacteriales bacterium]